MRIYLDNCCFNRPYDIQAQPKVKIDDAEVFLMNVKQDKFDYTEWRQTQSWLDMPLDELLLDLAESDNQYPQFRSE